MSYYSRQLAGERLRRVYELAPPRIRQYLQAEIECVRTFLTGRESVLELGCGYGRVMFALAPFAHKVSGVDTARESIELGEKLGAEYQNCQFHEMDASAMEFENDNFDLVVCIQNGICAFGVDPEKLFQEALRVTRPGGRVVVSSYSPRFWEDRLLWFELQATEGLVGPIDHERSKNGVIVCTDGFRSGTYYPVQLEDLGRKFGAKTEIREIDESSMFACYIKPTK